MITITDADFNTVLHTTQDLVVDFWQATCGDPCQQSLTMLQGLESEYPGVTFGKLDTATNPATASSQNITAWPTVVFYKNGVEQERLVGAQVTEQNVREALDRIYVMV